MIVSYLTTPPVPPATSPADLGQVRLVVRLVRWPAPGCTALNDIRFTLVLPQRHQSGIHVVAEGIGGASREASVGDGRGYRGWRDR